VERLVVVQVQFVNQSERCRGAPNLADRDGAVEGHDRRGGDRKQLVIQGDDLRPVGLLECASVRVHGVDRPAATPHSPTEHVFVGTGDEPCVILMAGARGDDWKVRYPLSELAAGHGASAAEETSDPDQAYAGFEPWRRGRPSYWDQLPWA
jgi:hypothetical protein